MAAATRHSARTGRNGGITAVPQNRCLGDTAIQMDKVHLHWQAMKTGWMPKFRSLNAILVLCLMAAGPAAAAEGSLSGLAERATDISLDTDQFLRDVNAEVLRLLQYDPTDADLAAIPQLIDAFHRSGADRQRDVLKLLAHLLAGSKNHRPAILDTAVQALQSPWHGVRVAALDVLGRSEDAAAVPKLIASLSDPDWEVRYQALYGLSFFIDRAVHQEIYEAVAPLVADKDERVREMARTLMSPAKGAERQNLQAPME